MDSLINYEEKYKNLLFSLNRDENYLYRDLGWPENLLTVLHYGRNEDEQGNFVLMDELPGDFMGTLEYVLCTLTEREQKVVRLRYQGQKKLEDIGKEFGVTRERIRQILHKAERKLRYPTRLRLLEKGMRVYYEEQIGGAKSVAYDQGYRAGFSDGCKTVNSNTEPMQNPMEEIFRTPIEELGLSVRSYNCLRIAGKETVGDLVQMDYKQLSKVRNLGRKSLEEIVRKLEELGLDTRRMKSDGIVS